MSYLIYLRKSRADAEAEARGEGETLSRHQAILEKLAADRDLPIGNIYRELVSGESIAARPQMQRLLAEIEQGRWQGVLVMEVERLARGNTIDQGMVAQAFQYSGAKIITPVKTYDPANEFDQEYFEFGLFMSRREYKTINRRMQQGRAVSASEGKFTGSRAPYGYQRYKLPGDKGYSLQPREDQAAIVCQIFRWYGEDGLGCGKIANNLNELSIPAANGGIWSAAAVVSLLHNPVYNGKICSGRRPSRKQLNCGEIQVCRPRAPEYLIYPGLHTRLIDDSLFDAVTQRLEQRSNLPSPKKRPLQNPLVGILVCPVCGRSMIRRPAADCRDQLLCPTRGCPTVGSYLSHTEELILSSLEKWYGHKSFCLDSQEAASAKNKAFLEQMLAKTNKTISGIKNQLENACNLLEQGIYDPPTFMERQRKLKNQEAILYQKQQELKEQLAKAANKTTASPPPLTLTEIYRACPDANSKNRLLKALLQRIDYYKTNSSRWQQTELRLIFYPLLPPDDITDKMREQKN